MAIEQMISVTLPMKVWDEISELVWDALPEIPCEGCNGNSGVMPEYPDCGICHGSGLSTMYHPSLDGVPIAEGARAIDRRITQSMSREARIALRDALRGE